VTDQAALSTPQVTIERVVDWTDTDAAGQYHHATVLRWAEAADAELQDQLGLIELFGLVPRVRYEVDYKARLWFRDQVMVHLHVAAVGGASVRYDHWELSFTRPPTTASVDTGSRGVSS
jgi:acyl-CoA thioester hydrolase